MIFQFDSLADFIAMSGHGIYVWACYFITLTVIVLLIVLPVWQKKQLVKQVRRQRKLDIANQYINEDTRQDTSR